MESGQLLRSMMGGETGLQLQLPPMATATEHASDHFSTQIQAANLLQFGQHMTDSRSHIKRNTDRPQSNIFHNGRAQAESAIKKQRTSSSLAVNPHSISIPSPVVNVGVVNTGLNGVYHPALPTIQGLVNISSSTPQQQAIALHNFGGQQIAVGLHSHTSLLPVPFASLQALNAPAVQAASNVLPLFHHAHANAAGGVSVLPLVQALEDILCEEQKGSLFEELERHMHRGGGDAGTARNIRTQAVAQGSFAYQAPDRCEPAGSGSGGSSTTTNQNSNSGSNSASDDDGRYREEDGGSRRLARREYHKKIERKRRDRMRSLYDELRALTDAAEVADKNGVLQAAISLIQQQRQQIEQLEKQPLRHTLNADKHSASSSTSSTLEAGSLHQPQQQQHARNSLSTQSVTPPPSLKGEEEVGVNTHCILSPLKSAAVSHSGSEASLNQENDLSDSSSPRS